MPGGAFRGQHFCDEVKLLAPSFRESEAKKENWGEEKKEKAEEEPFSRVSEPEICVSYHAM